MSENCVVCGQPMPSRREQIAEMEKRMVAMTSVIAAAEERGRRAGIEERDELRARLWEALSVIESRAPDMTLLIPRIKVALAPRDSGKET